MKITKNVTQARQYRHSLGGRVALVPTMGALHEGHLTLMRAAHERADHVIASIFVNPKQFGAGEDLEAYPRTLEADIAALETVGVSQLFLPSSDLLYPQGFATTVMVGGMDDILCGAHRPGHFHGVTTVVALLFTILRPDIAIFGEKDYQQLAIIKRMNQDLYLVDQIHGVPTIREADGLALSSRNCYLSEEERRVAPSLHHVMQWIGRQWQAGDALPALLEAGKEKILHAGFANVQYLEARHQHSLQLVDTPESARLFVAAQIGSTRLIDNIALAIPSA